jgi:pimeloyl-ACP methyl ester carboxylesterase
MALIVNNSRRIRSRLVTAVALAGTVTSLHSVRGAESGETSGIEAENNLRSAAEVRYRTVKVDGLDIFYREAGVAGAPTLLLLHGFPTSSQMFRNLIPLLADRYHIVAPDYPGFGQSSQPPREQFEYTFDKLARVVDGFTEQLKLEKFTIYVQDYGAPIGYRIASVHPERIAGIIVQNGNAYDEGLDNDFWKPLKKYWAQPTAENREALRGFLAIEATKWQYLHGARNPENISPDAWTLDQAGLDRPGNKEIQLDLFLSYGTNPPLYPAWQKYFREHQPPTLVVWGKNDQIFPAAGAEPYKQDLKNLDYNILDTGHFALEEDGSLIAAKIREFMEKRVVKATK